MLVHLREMRDRPERLLIHLDDEDTNRIRLLAVQCRSSITEIVRRCVEKALDTVELEIVSEAHHAGRLRPINIEQQTRIEDLRTELSVGPDPEESE
jgi:hypothetical protein